MRGIAVRRCAWFVLWSAGFPQQPIDRSSCDYSSWWFWNTLWLFYQPSLSPLVWFVSERKQYPICNLPVGTVNVAAQDFFLFLWESPLIIESRPVGIRVSLKLGVIFWSLVQVVLAESIFGDTWSSNCTSLSFSTKSRASMFRRFCFPQLSFLDPPYRFPILFSLGLCN